VDKFSVFGFKDFSGAHFLRGGLFVLFLAAVLFLFPCHARANDLAALQTSVISTDLFLQWVPAQKSELGLSSEQIEALRGVQGDFKEKSEEIGQRIQRNASLLTKEVSKYPINLKKIKPAIEEISQLRGNLTYSAIKSLFRVQSILRQSQWDQAKSEWAHILAEKTVAPFPPAPSRSKGRH
jgi:hypothetical protein